MPQRLGIHRLDEARERLLRLMGRQGQRLLSGGGLRQAPAQILRRAQLGDRLGRIQLGRGALRAGGRGHEQPLGAAQHAPALGGQLEALTAPSPALGTGRRLMDQIAQAQLARGGAGGQARAQLPRRIIGEPLVETRPLQGDAVMPRDHPRMIGPGSHPRRPGQRILAVIEAAHDVGPVDVAVDEAHQHLGADTRDEVRAPVGAGLAGGEAHPQAALFIARGVAGESGPARAAGVGQAARVGLIPALPGKLDLHPQVALGGQCLACHPHHQGTGQPRGERGGAVARHHGHAGGQQIGAVAVGTRLQSGLGQQRRMAGGEVVGPLMFHRQGQETVLAGGILAGGVGVVAGEGEHAPGAQGPHTALQGIGEPQAGEGFQGEAGQAFGVGAVAVAVLAGAGIVFEHRQIGLVEGVGGAVGDEVAVVPGGAGHGVGGEPAQRLQAVDAVSASVADRR